MVQGLAGLLLLASPATVEDLVQVEANFLQAVKSRGAEQAYAASLAPGGIRFHPAASPALVARRPVRAGMARSKNWGYVAGLYREKDGSSGQYVAVWRQNGGGWRLLFEFAAPSVPAYSAFQDVGPTYANKIVADSEEAKSALIATDWALANDPNSIAAFLDPRVAVLRSRVGLLDKSGAAKAMRQETWSPIRALVAPSADLGCTYGAVAYGQGGRGDYARIWARDELGAWRIVLDFGAKR